MRHIPRWLIGLLLALAAPAAAQPTVLFVTQPPCGERLRDRQFRLRQSPRRDGVDAARRRPVDPLRRRHPAQPHRRGRLRPGDATGDRRARAVRALDRHQGTVLDGGRRHDQERLHAGVLADLRGQRPGRRTDGADRPPAAARERQQRLANLRQRRPHHLHLRPAAQRQPVAVPAARRVRVDADRHRHLVDGGRRHRPAPARPRRLRRLHAAARRAMDESSSRAGITCNATSRATRGRSSSAPSTTPPRAATRHSPPAPRSFRSCATSRRAATRTATP